jgi:hypothetical protein
MRPAWAALALVAGCGSGGSPAFPFERGVSWTYRVSREFGSRIETLTAFPGGPVGSRPGWWIKGPSGTSLLAVDGGTVWAAELGGTRFDPPIPIVATRSRGWTGTVVAPHGPVRAKAALACRAGPGQETESALKVIGPGIDLQVTTWTRPGVGIVRQDERSKGRRLMRAELVAGPTSPR